MASPILYQNDFVTILDIPRSLELVQGPFFTQKIISSPPLQKPYPSVEAKSEKAKANLGDPSIEDLLLEKHIELVLQDVKNNYQGPWCLPRTTAPVENDHEESHPKKRRKLVVEEIGKEKGGLKQEGPLFQNDSASSTYLDIPGGSRAHLSPQSVALQGGILETLPLFNKIAPKFNVIFLDPPWPNRSARRKNAYEISYSSLDIKTLLSSIPISSHLEDDGFVGVWITNKPAFREMLLEEGRLFDLWDVEFIEEWIWLKVTEHGKPVCGLNSMWRKPYEILLVGRKKGSLEHKQDDGGVKRRVIIGVPDLHSRKPNLKMVFGKAIGREGFKGLEIFARNMTGGWWAWGNEVLKFQGEEHWVSVKQDS